MNNDTTLVIVGAIMFVTGISIGVVLACLGYRRKV